MVISSIFLGLKLTMSFSFCLLKIGQLAFSLQSMALQKLAHVQSAKLQSYEIRLTSI